MSGIFGIFCRDGGSPDPAELQRMQAVFAHWYDDDRGLWCGRTAALGHQMLWNTPESRFEQLPQKDTPEGHSLVITADARLDNRVELAEKLGLETPIHRITDSQLLLAAYRQWGEESPRHLLGDFAYAIWDERESRLFCARDHIGIKQLYFYSSGDLFVFANDIRALAALSCVPAELNKEAIAIFLQSSPYLHRRRTFYEFIEKLEPANTLLVCEKKVYRKVYWRAEDSPPIRFNTTQEYVARLKELLEDSVRLRSRSVYPVISHLSGGLDSSAITVLAAKALAHEGKVPQVFNWAYMPDSERDPDCIEWSYAKKVAAEQNIPVDHISIRPEFVQEALLSGDISAYDESTYWEETAAVVRYAKSGSRTVLSGWGGDELISYGGYSLYSALIRRGKPFHAYRLIVNNGRKRGLSWTAILKKCMRSSLYAFFSKNMNGLYKPERDDAIFKVLQPDFTPVVRALRPQLLRFRSVPHGEQIELFNHGHLTSRIESWAALGQRNAVEYRYPLLDRRIVEFALGVPERLFVPRNGYSRFLFRSAVADILPGDVVWAPKFHSPKHFEARKALWLSALGLLLTQKKYLFDISQEYIDGKALYRIIEEVVKIDSTDFESQENVRMLYPAIAVAVLNKSRRSADC